MPSQPLPQQIASIIADDLTGATDTVVQFRQVGWHSHLLVGPPGTPLAIPPDTGFVALARSMDTRSLGHDEAAQRTAQAVTDALQHASTRLYLKIDSTLRGSVAGQVRGALQAWRARHPDCFALICPAYPDMGRMLIDGHLFVHGTPLHESAIGIDPVTPVLTHSVCALIPGARPVPRAASHEALIARLQAEAVPGAQLVVDAHDAADLRRLALAIDHFGGRAVPVGSAGLAIHLAEVWRGGRAATPPAPPATVRPGRVVVVITSLNQVSLEQAVQLREALGSARLVHHALSPDELVHASHRRHAAEQITASPADVVLLQPTAASQRATPAQARAVASGLAALVADLVARDAVAGLVLVGGDGAQATLDALATQAVRIDASIMEGVPFGHLIGGHGAQLPVATKAGGFGHPTALVEIVAALRRPAPHHTTA